MSGKEINSISWEEEFNCLFDNSLIGVAFTSIDGVFTKVNKKLCSIFEYSQEDLEKKHWKEVTFKEDLEKSESFIEACVKNKNYHTVLEKRYVTGKGRVIVCRVTLSAVRNKDDGIKFFIVQIEDITSLKELVKNIKLGREFLQESIKKL